MDIPTDILEFAKTMRTAFGQGVKLRSVEKTNGEAIGWLPDWWSLCRHLDAEKSANRAPIAVRHGYAYHGAGDESSA